MASSAVRLTLAEQVAAALRAAGHKQAFGEGAGFSALGNGDGGVIVVADLGAHAEGHWDSPGQRAARARIVSAYAKDLEAAGWVAQVRPPGTGLVVTGRAEVARLA
jgi:hypothetical protein